jgi:ribose/xylose/arabinose/galactoside ABC-type transport system permease subunit
VFAGAIVTQLLKMGMMAIGLPTTFNKVVIGVFVVIFMVGSSRADLLQKLGAKLRRKKDEVNA